MAFFLFLVVLISPSLCSPQFGHSSRSLFEFAPDWVNLNHGSYGTTPISILKALPAYQSKMEQAPDLWFRYQYQDDVARARANVAAFIGAAAEDVVFEINASQSLNVVIRSLGKKGVLFLNLAYPVVPNTAAYMASVTGEENVVVQISFPISDEGIVKAVEAALAARGGQVGLCSFSHIVSVPGIILPVKRLTEVCTRYGALTMIDGAHTIGQMAINVTDIGCAFYLSNGHKWLFSPKGTSFLWADKRYQRLLVPTVVSHAINGTFQDMFLWQGTMDYSGYLAMGNDAIAFHSSFPGGSQGVFEYLHNLAVEGGRVLAKLWGTEALVEDHRIAAMVNVRMPANCTGAIADVINDHLLQTYKTWVPIFRLNQPGGQIYIRVSAQVYLELSDFENLGNAIVKIINQLS
jgi:selenocysteine lyase/cysteine desulfurase